MGAGLFTPSRGRVLVFGAGYVGLATAAAALIAGWSVTVLDTSAARIETHRNDIAAGRDPLGEPGMRSALGRAFGADGVVFSSYVEDAPGLPEMMRDAVVVCAVGTPLLPEKRTTDAGAVLRVAKLASLHHAAVFVLRSTVDPGVLRDVRAALGDVALVVMPEFLREGHAVTDSLHPARIVVGVDDGPKWSNFGGAFLVQPGLSEFGRPPVQVLLPEEASLMKLALNTALSLRVWLADAVGAFCESVPGANADRVLDAVYRDKRLGSPGTPGLGAAGPCLPKDTTAFARAVGSSLPLALRDDHDRVPMRLIERIKDTLGRRLGTSRPRVTVLGVGFKPDSSDWRGSPAVGLAWALSGGWADVEVRDDRVPEHELEALRAELGPSVRFEAHGSEIGPSPTVLVILSKEALRPVSPADGSPVVRTLEHYQGRSVAGEYRAPPQIVADPFRLTWPGSWPLSTYLGGGLGPT